MENTQQRKDQYAFIEYPSFAGVVRAMKAMDQKMMGDSKIRVSLKVII